MVNSLTYNGQKINQRADGYVNATQMCQANGKRVNNWLRNKETQEYIRGIASVTQISATDLVVSIQGGDPSDQGTWIHPKLAICLGRWVSVPFAIWCDEHIRTLIQTGSTAIAYDHTKDPNWIKGRQEGKKARLTLTDTVKAYIERHPELSENAKQWMHSQYSDKLNRGVFGRSAKQLRQVLGIKDNSLLRNEFQEDEISALRDVENIAAWFIHKDDLHPVKAIAKAIKQVEYELRFIDRHTTPKALSEASGNAMRQLSLF